MRLLTLAAAFVAGIWLADRLAISVPGLSLLALAGLLGIALLFSLRRSILPALLVVAVVAGALRVEALGPRGEGPLLAYHGRAPLQIEGVVVGDPRSRGVAATLRLSAEQINTGDGWADTTGEVLVTLRASVELVRSREPPYFRYGDRLQLEGPLASPQPLEGFDYPTYLARQGIRSVMAFPKAALVAEGEGSAFYGWLYGARRGLARSLEQAVPEPQASVGQALLLGIRDGIPDGMVEDFRDTGTSHVLAISGLHVGIMLFLSLGISIAALGRRHHVYLVAPATLVWLYALISGLSPSATRAAIMASVYLLALLVGRPRSVLPALGFAAAVMVAVDPEVLFSVSFQLSFAAVTGIATLAPPMSRLLKTPFSISEGGGDSRQSAVTWLFARGADLTVLTMAATVATLPLVAFHFERVSLIGVAATLLVLPALPLIVVTQALAALSGVASVSLGHLLGLLAWVTTSYLTAVVGGFAKVPGIALETGRLAPFLVWGYYGAAAAVTAALACARRMRRTSISQLLRTASVPLADKRASWWLVGLAVSLAVLSWTAALSLPDQRLHVAFVDVGQGDGAFVTTPSGRQVVVDGGSDPLVMVRALAARMPPGDRTVDIVVLTHPHTDHVNGLLEVLRRYEVALVLERQIAYDSSPHEAWRRLVERSGAAVVQAEAGQVISMGDGVILRVVGPPARLLHGTASDVDNTSVVLIVEYGDVSFLMTGDMFEEGEAALVESGAPIDSDVLKVGHHGSRSSSSREFLDAVTPTVAIISAGQDNRFGHPHSESLLALQQHVAEELLFLTNERGTVEFVTDGDRLEVSTER